MKAKISVLILVAVISVNVSCTDVGRPELTAYKEVDLTRDLYETNLMGSWSRSLEEEPDHDGVQIYRRTESKEFQTVWFRMRYVLNEDHSCQWLVLHPSDMHYMTSGTWEVDPRDKTVILIYDADGEIAKTVSFEVIELGADLLRIKRLSN